MKQYNINSFKQAKKINMSADFDKAINDLIKETADFKYVVEDSNEINSVDFNTLTVIKGE